jgi:hypothetical protein
MGNIAELTALVPPPKEPKDAGPEAQWSEIQNSLGTQLPDDYRDFGRIYGSGDFKTPSSIAVYVCNPFAPWFLQFVQQECADHRNLKEDGYVPYDFYPLSPGLLPCGGDDNGNRLYLLTQGQPNEWPVVVVSRAADVCERFELPLTTFLAKAFKREIVPKIWDAEEFFSEVPAFRPEPATTK